MLCFGIIVMTCQLIAQPVPDTFCAIYRPVYWSAADTRRTKEQADSNNRKWKRLCKGAASAAAAGG